MVGGGNSSQEPKALGQRTVGCVHTCVSVYYMTTHVFLGRQGEWDTWRKTVHVRQGNAELETPFSRWKPLETSSIQGQEGLATGKL